MKLTEIEELESEIQKQAIQRLRKLSKALKIKPVKSDLPETVRIEPKIVDNALRYLKELTGNSWDFILKMYFQTYYDPFIQKDPRFDTNYKKFRQVLSSMKLLLTHNTPQDTLRERSEKLSIPYLMRGLR